MSELLDAMQGNVLPNDPTQQGGQQVPPDPAPTEAEIAAKKGAPKTEGDKSKAEPVVFDIDLGNGKKRVMTQEQIAGTISRYSNLNYQNMQNKPINTIVERMIGEGKTHDEIAQAMERAFQKEPEMGGQNKAPMDDRETNKDAPSNVNVSDAIKKWSDENGMEAPPHYIEMINNMSQITEMMNSLPQMLQGMIAGNKGITDAAKETQQQANQTRTDSMRQQISNNLDAAQRKFSIPSEKAKDFMTFSAQRGFTPADFVDSQMVEMLMQDFRNNMEAPEIGQLREVMKKRQAFSGTVTPTPATQGAAPPEADELMSSMINKRM